MSLLSAVELDFHILAGWNFSDGVEIVIACEFE